MYSLTFGVLLEVSELSRLDKFRDACICSVQLEWCGEKNFVKQGTGVHE